MFQFTEHILEKKEKNWHCKICQRIWKSKPRSDCPGVEYYNGIPENLTTEQKLKNQNLKPSEPPIGATYFRSRNSWVALYDPQKVTILDPDLPPIYTYEDRGELKFEWELRKINLAPDEATPKSGVVRWWDKDSKTYSWEPLYKPEDCHWKARDNYITKTTLKKKYLLSEGWIKKLGEPDLIKENPHFDYGSPMKLYSRQRIEKYLADHSEEYAKWLIKRDKYVEHYYRFKDKIEAAKKQKQLCESCRSGCSFYSELLDKNVFLCTIYPGGLETIPCPEFCSRD